MYLKACTECRYGDTREGKSHCSREAVYSYLTNCIQQKAMEYYLDNQVVEEQVSDAV